MNMDWGDFFPHEQMHEYGFGVIFFSPDFPDLYESDPSCVFDWNELKVRVFHVCNLLSTYQVKPERYCIISVSYTHLTLPTRRTV